MQRPPRVLQVAGFFVLTCGLARMALGGCENSITVRAPGFEYVYNDVAPYARAPLGQDAVSDSIFHALQARNYQNLARGLAVAAQIYRCASADSALEHDRESKRNRTGFWQSPYHDLRRRRIRSRRL